MNIVAEKLQLIASGVYNSYFFTTMGTEPTQIAAFVEALLRGDAEYGYSNMVAAQKAVGAGSKHRDLILLIIIGSSLYGINKKRVISLYSQLTSVQKEHLKKCIDAVVSTH